MDFDLKRSSREYLARKSDVIVPQVVKFNVGDNGQLYGKYYH